MAEPTAQHIDVLVRRLGPRVLTGEDVVPYMRDTSRAQPVGRPLAVVLASGSDDVRTALVWASQYGVPVSIRGAGTGLSGGAVSYPDGLVISMAGMTRIIAIDPANRLAIVEPGVISADLDRAAAQFGLMYAPDPASVERCTIGGTIATNAGGLRSVSRGVTRDAVAALEVVLADGRIIDTGSRTRKNSTGYDLTGLFVGSEGTLGVVTQATLRLLPRPTGTPVSFRAEFATARAAGAAVSLIMGSSVTPEVLELMDRATLEVIEAFFPSGLHAAGAAILVGQVVGPGAQADAAMIGALCSQAGAIFVDLEGADSVLEARRLAGPALDARGLRASCDVTVPPSELADMFDAVERIGREEGFEVFCVAHAGDGNLHPTVQVPDESAESMMAAERIIDRITRIALDLGGMISGEHGIGSLKIHALGEQFDDSTWGAHKAIRAALDPQGILSPGRAV